MGRLAGAVIAILIAPVSPTIASDWLPLTKSQIVSLTVGSANIESLKIELVDEETRAKLKSLAADESAWAALNTALKMGIFVAGKGENIHTIRMPVSTLNISRSQEETDRVFRLLSDLFSNIIPDWPEARNWPVSSLKEAWNAQKEALKNADPNYQIVKKTLGGITIATFGMPPDFIIYTITARDACIPDMKQGTISVPC